MRRFITLLAFAGSCGGVTPAFAQTVDTALIRASIDSATPYLAKARKRTTSTVIKAWLDSASVLMTHATDALHVPPPIVVVPPPPPPIPAPVPAPSGAYASVVSDSFTTYSSTADLLSHFSVNAGGTGQWDASKYTGLNAQLVSLDRTVLCDGHPTMRYDQPGGTMNTPQVYADFPNRQALAKTWYRVTLRYSPGWTTRGTLTNSSNAYKVIGWGLSGADGSGRLEITNTIQYEIYEGASLRTGGAATSNTPATYGYPGSIATEWTDGKFYDYVILIDHTTKDGVIKAWYGLHGTVPTYRASATSSRLDGLVFYPVYSVMIGMNFNQVRAATQSQSINICRFEAVDATKYANPFGVQ